MARAFQLGNTQPHPARNMRTSPQPPPACAHRTGARQQEAPELCEQNEGLQRKPFEVGTYIAVRMPDTVILLGCSAIYWHSQYFGLLSIGIYRIYRVNFTQKHEKGLRNRPLRLVVSRRGCAIDASAPLVAPQRLVFYAPGPGIPDSGAGAPGKAALHRPSQQQRQSELS